MINGSKDHCTQIQSCKSTNKMHTKYPNSPTINLEGHPCKGNSKASNTEDGTPNSKAPLNSQQPTLVSPTKHSSNPSTIIISKSVSHDGTYKVISRTLEGEDLKEAV
jgi:hypothetical protein